MISASWIKWIQPVLVHYHFRVLQPELQASFETLLETRLPISPARDAIQPGNSLSISRSEPCACWFHLSLDAVLTTSVVAMAHLLARVLSTHLLQLRGIPSCVPLFPLFHLVRATLIVPETGPTNARNILK